MIARRDLILAGLGLGAAGLAQALIPRRRRRLLARDVTIAQAFPQDFGRWSAATAPGLVSPEQAGKLARTLYSEILQLIYYDRNTSAAVMLLAAYGDTQSDLLQLHRPEVCYPAVGFTLKSSEAARLQVAPKTILPVRRVVAAIEDRNENIVYWTRLGEALPQSEGAQRKARFDDAVEGFVSDGILVRCSAIGETEASFAVLDSFIPEMLQAVKANQRAALIGTRLAADMASQGGKA